MRQRLDHPLKLLVGGAQDAPERQRTLRATIDWSYELLEQAEQRLSCGSQCSLVGAPSRRRRAVCGDDLEAVDGLGALTDEGLTRLEGSDESRDSPCWRRSASTQQNVSSSQRRRRALHWRHAEHFLGLAEEAEPNLIGVGSHAAWLDRLERDHDNFRVAMDWLEASGDSDGALRLTAALWRFWDLKGHLIEGRRQLGESTTAPRSARPRRAPRPSAAPPTWP